MHELVPRPSAGRVYETTRRVRLGDADPTGRLRLDAIARLLQDVGNDDFADAGLDPSSPWIARRTTVVVRSWPRIGERVTFATWCGGMGSHWAERRTSIGGGAIEVAGLWVHVDGATGRPARVPQWFLDTYGTTAGDRRIKARLAHGDPPADLQGRPWPLRHTDLDVLGHVNNASTWAPVEDECARRGLVPRVAELEFGAALDPGDDVRLRAVAEPGGLRLWLAVGDQVRAAAAVRGDAGGPGAQLVGP